MPVNRVSLLGCQGQAKDLQSTHSVNKSWDIAAQHVQGQSGMGYGELVHLIRTAKTSV